MSLKLYNTLSNKKEPFKPINEGKVGMYVCGPTVNGIPHLGHARSQIFFDVFRRYLLYSGYDVKFVSNITDIEDKIIQRANELKIPINELVQKNYAAHMQDYKEIGILPPDFQPRATEFVDKMISLIKSLEQKGFTYIIEGDGVYYDVSKFSDYGKLSKINLDELKSSRELRDESKGKQKRDQKDFVLWKFSKPNEPSWKSPWGEGRPGWHIECSTMTHEILGNPFDIHGGGQDLIFPHHEDEIAQSEAGYGTKMCNYWVHNGMVNVDSVKMSKSLNNFKTIKDILKKYKGEVLRYFTINAHYRKPIDFSEEKLNEAKTSYNRLKRLTLALKQEPGINEKYLEEFKKEMDEDLNTAGALNVLWKLLKDDSAKSKLNTVKEIEKVFALNLTKQDSKDIPEEVKNLLEKRKLARENKNWQLSDELREKIKSLGFLVSDSKDTQSIEPI